MPSGANLQLIGHWLFRRFREGNPHLARVAYDGQSPIGFITLDNLMGALVGEIRDEFRRTRNECSELDIGSLIGEGSRPIETVERALGFDIDEAEFDPVGGLILQTVGINRAAASMLLGIRRR